MTVASLLTFCSICWQFADLKTLKSWKSFNKNVVQQNLQSLPISSVPSSTHIWVISQNDCFDVCWLRKSKRHPWWICTCTSNSVSIKTQKIDRFVRSRIVPIYRKLIVVLKYWLYIFLISCIDLNERVSFVTDLKKPITKKEDLDILICLTTLLNIINKDLLGSKFWFVSKNVINKYL